MDCYCGMFEGHCPYEIGGECHNEIDATECSDTYTPPHNGYLT